MNDFNFIPDEDIEQTDVEDVSQTQDDFDFQLDEQESEFGFSPDGGKEVIREQKSLIDQFKSGLQESTSGKAAQVAFGVKPLDTQEDDSLGSALVSTAGEISGDMPFYLIGGALGTALGSIGGPVGMVAGGAIGTFALPAFMKQAIKEYQYYVDEGNDLTFGEFLTSADNIASETLTAGAFGLILGSLGKGMDKLAKVPMFKKMFDTKYVGKTLKKTAKAIGIGSGATAVSAGVEGRLPTGKELATNILIAGGFEAAQATAEQASRIGDAFTKSNVSPEKFWKSKNAQELKSKLIEEGLPRTSRETQEKALKTLQQGAKPEVKIDVKPEADLRPKSIQGAPEGFGDRRITVRSKRLASQEPEVRKQVKTVGDIASKEAFVSDTEAGRDIQSTVKAESSKEHAGVKELYNTAEKLYEGHDDVYEDLYSHISEKLSEVEQTLDKSPGEKKAIAVYKNILNRLAPKGDSQNGYTQVSVKSLIKTSNSISSTLNYETTEPDTRNILKELPRRLNKEARFTLESRGIDAEPLKAADKAYGEWANKYINDEMSPYFERREVRPEELYNLSKKEKQYRSIEEALPDGKKKKRLLDKLSRDIIEERMSPYYGKPDKVGNNKYVREIDNLKALIGTTSESLKKIENIDSYLRKSTKAPEPRKATAQEKTIAATQKKAMAERQLAAEGKETAYTKRIAAVAKFAKMKPEDIARKMTTRTGIRELEAELDKVKDGDKLFGDLRKQKIRDIFEQGNINKDSTAQDLYNVMNNQKNYEIMEELSGKGDAKAILDELKRLDKKARSQEKLMKWTKAAAMTGGGLFLMKEIKKAVGLTSSEESYN